MFLCVCLYTGAHVFCACVLRPELGAFLFSLLYSPETSSLIVLLGIKPGLHAYTANTLTH